jgi:VanZ family protein
MNLLSYRLGFVTSILTISFLALIEPASFSSQSLINDKILHFLCFAYLTILCKFARFFDQDIWVYVIVLGYGILIEIVQLYIPHRSFEFLDILADLIGIFFASLFLKLSKDFYTSY